VTNQPIHFGLFLLALSMAMPPRSGAQDPSKPAARTVQVDRLEQGADSIKMLAALIGGKWHGQFRNFSMATVNQGSLSDYWANATGGTMSYKTAFFRKFQMVLGGSLVVNVASNDLAAFDSATGAPNRYEIALFDVMAPEKKAFTRCEALQLRYEFAKGQVVWGKQALHTPFINPQDGRMLPTAVEGLTTRLNPNAKWQLEGAYVYKVAARGAAKWLPIGQSIGVYGQGRNPDGSPSAYANHTSSKGILLMAAHYKTTDSLHVQVWNQWTTNVFNTSMLQADFTRRAASGWVTVSAQWTHQLAAGNGGNDDPKHAYFQKGNRCNVLSSQLAWKNLLWEAGLSGTRIGGGGRFLSPREWGREPFFTFQPRERMDGLGNVWAWMGRIARQIAPWHLNTYFTYGQYHLPAHNRFALNKYALPSYRHLIVGTNYTPQGRLSGFDLQCFYVHKSQLGGTTYPATAIINKVNLSHFNIIISYRF
jgi:hypothetical protein